MASKIRNFSSKQDEPEQARAGLASHRGPLLTPALAFADSASFKKIFGRDVMIFVILGLGHNFNDFD
tara:strand:- start:605 stop:805 length:201 start_codon:yes stop_codon:yes gene_type:complete